MADERNHAAPGTGGGPSVPRVYDIREWGPRPTLRRVGAPRALWARSHQERPVPPPAAITPVRHVPVRSAPVATAASGPVVLMIGCAESPALERLGSGLRAATLIRNLGGVAPRSPQGRGDVAALEAALAAAARLDRPLHVTCAGHLGCHAIRASARYALSASGGASPDRALRALEHHVFMQLHRVRTYLRRRGRHPEVRVSGVWIDEDTGHVHVFDPSRRAFTPLASFDLDPFATTVPARAD